MNRQGWGVDLEHLEAQILKNLPLSTSHGGAFVSMYYSAKKTLDMSMEICTTLLFKFFSTF